MSGDAQVILDALAEHRRETRDGFSELRNATVEMAKAVADLTTTVARVEERHARHDDGLKRVGRTLDDHEERLRTLERDEDHENRLRNLEQDKATVVGGWKAVAVVAAVLSSLVSVGFQFAGKVFGP